MVIGSKWESELKAEIDHMAAENPDGSYILVLTNRTASPQQVEIRFGSSSVRVELTPDSITSLRWSR
jgi:hypothetical protein